MNREALSAAINQAAGAELRGLRAKRGVSRPQLREMTGLGISTIQRIENGERSPELDQLALILKALDMPMIEFVALALRDVDGIE
jgi:transcriptional regulator with XRE-family HTH domain